MNKVWLSEVKQVAQSYIKKEIEETWMLAQVCQMTGPMPTSILSQENQQGSLKKWPHQKDVFEREVW